jgi:heme exporter protein D
MLVWSSILLSVLALIVVIAMQVDARSPRHKHRSGRRRGR